jgi:phospholipid/cholesterol/gamma-HCH transport system substrate-binding protein
MKRTTLDFWVGLFVAAGIAALVFLAIYVSSINTTFTSTTYTLYAEFENIGGLKVRAPVKSAGVVIGRVSSIRLNPDKFLAQVSLEINDSYQFSRDSSAEILTAGLLGEQYIGITSGADTIELKAGDTIKHTSSAIVLERLISQFLFSKAESEDISKSHE